MSFTHTQTHTKKNWITSKWSHHITSHYWLYLARGRYFLMGKKPWRSEGFYRPRFIICDAGLINSLVRYDFNVTSLLSPIFRMTHTKYYRSVLMCTEVLTQPLWLKWAFLLITFRFQCVIIQINCVEIVQNNAIQLNKTTIRD